MNRFLLFLAQGFGIGRIPFAPGTWGSLVGVGLFFLLIVSGSVVNYLMGACFFALLSVPICAAGEKALNQKDPGSVVWDELCAIPIALLPLVLKIQSSLGHFPTIQDCLKPRWLFWIGVGFFLFRFFDIQKPWIIARVQRFPGGWGVTVDDLLAALASALVLSVLLLLWS